jgi:hypothetical protein
LIVFFWFGKNKKALVWQNIVEPQYRLPTNNTSLDAATVLQYLLTYTKNYEILISSKGKI